MRSSRAPVTRLSRKVLLGLGAVAAVGIGGALFFALRPQQQTTGSELYNTSNRTTPDGLANLPRDYTGLPRDRAAARPAAARRSRPADRQRRRAGSRHADASGGPDPEQQRIAQEQEAARTSHLFATTNVGQIATATSPALAAAQATAASLTGGSNDLTSQDHKLAFLNGNVDRRTVSPDRVRRRPVRMCCRPAP